MRIAVAGTGRLGVAVMEPLIASEHEVVALILNGRDAQGYRRTVGLIQGRLLPRSESPIALAAAHGIPRVWLDQMDEEGLAPLRALAPDLLITCGFSVILKRALLDLPSIGCINVHSSLLPHHRGPTPFVHSILAGEAISGVTIHVTDEDIDTGAILDQTSFELEPDETALTAYRKGAAVTRDRILEVVNTIAREGLRGTPQPPGGSYDRKLDDGDLEIDWGKPAVDLDQLIRSVHPFQYTWFLHRERPVRILSARYDASHVNQPPGIVLRNRPYVHVATGEGTLIIRKGYTYTPIPWLWPSALARPGVGESLARR